MGKVAPGNPDQRTRAFRRLSADRFPAARAASRFSGEVIRQRGRSPSATTAVVLIQRPQEAPVYFAKWRIAE